MCGKKHFSFLEFYSGYFVIPPGITRERPFLLDDKVYLLAISACRVGFDNKSPGAHSLVIHFIKGALRRGLCVNSLFPSHFFLRTTRSAFPTITVSWHGSSVLQDGISISYMFTQMHRRHTCALCPSIVHAVCIVP